MKIKDILWFIALTAGAVVSFFIPTPIARLGGILCGFVLGMMITILLSKDK